MEHFLGKNHLLMRPLEVGQHQGRRAAGAPRRNASLHVLRGFRELCLSEQELRPKPELLSPPAPPHAVGLLVLLGAHGARSPPGPLLRVRVLLHAVWLLVSPGAAEQWAKGCSTSSRWRAGRRCCRGRHRRIQHWRGTAPHVPDSPLPSSGKPSRRGETLRPAEQEIKALAKDFGAGAKATLVRTAARTR